MKKQLDKLIPQLPEYKNQLTIFIFCFVFLLTCMAKVSAIEINHTPNLLTEISGSEQTKISGIVTDAITGEPLPGVNIIIKGSNIGATTNGSGMYTLSSKMDDKTILIFSFIGYVNQEIRVAGKTTIDVALNSDNQQIDEVVVTGYGTQQKVSMTGSVSAIKSEELKSIPTPSIAQSMAGRTTGLFVKNQRSQPGDYTGVSFNVRGYGDALIIIDGLPATNEEFQLLDPNDIDQINILKDAATAGVYGARSGNGVILVKTKRGVSGEAKFSYSFNYGLQQLMMIPGHTNSVQLAQYENVSRMNTGLTPKWSQSDIDKFKAGNDPAYPNTDWWDLTLRKNAPQKQHNLTVSGGTSKVKYFFSGGYFDQESNYRSNSLNNQKFNFRSNVDVALTDKLNIGVDLSVLQNDIMGPSWNMSTAGHGGGHWGIMMMLWRSRPQYPASFPDPTKSVGMGGDDPNPVDPTKIDKVGYTKSNAFTGDMKFNVAYKLPYGFGVKALFNYKKYYFGKKTHEKEGPVYYITNNPDGTVGYTQYLTYNSYNKIIEDYTQSNFLNQQYFLTWNRKFGDHKMDGLLVYEHLASEGTWNSASRIRYAYDIDFLFAGPDLDKNNNGTGWQDGRIGQIFTFNYSYKDKYLLGLSARRDGSPKFAEDSRWGLFPAASIGWRISQEEFMKKIPVISNLKLRGSAGLLGYDATGNFQYLSSYSIQAASLMVGNVVNSSIRANSVANPYITWEKITTYNVGLDFGLFDNKLNGAFDMFYRYRSDVLGTNQTALPDIVGANMPKENIEEYSNRGLEFELNYTGKFKSVNYRVGGNISYSREKIEYVSQPAYATAEIRRRNNRIGTWSDQKWGYLSDGVFLTQDEIDNWAILDGKNNGRVQVGDMRIIDYNKDGIINSDDQVVIGRGISPDIIYGLYGNFSWKGISLDMLWQGAGLFDLSYGNADMAMPFAGGNAPLLEMYKYSYTPENPWGAPVNMVRNPLYPKYYAEGYAQGPNQTNFNSDFWFRKGDYLRLKTLELAYNIPKTLTNRINVANLKVYFSGFNLLTFSKLKFLDPEFQSDVLHAWGASEAYPPTKTYSFGLVLDF